MDGYRNIKSIHEQYFDGLYLCILKLITHNEIELNNLCKNLVEENIIFNEFIHKELDIVSNPSVVEITIPDYIYGYKCNNIFKKIVNIFNCKAPLIIPKESFFCLYDEELISYILLIVMNIENKDLQTLNVTGCYSYSFIVDFIKKYKDISLMRLLYKDKEKNNSVKIENELYKYILSLL